MVSSEGKLSCCLRISENDLFEHMSYEFIFLLLFATNNLSNGTFWGNLLGAKTCDWFGILSRFGPGPSNTE